MDGSCRLGRAENLFKVLDDGAIRAPDSTRFPVWLLSRSEGPCLLSGVEGGSCVKRESVVTNLQVPSTQLVLFGDCRHD